MIKHYPKKILHICFLRPDFFQLLLYASEYYCVSIYVYAPLPLCFVIRAVRARPPTFRKTGKSSSKRNPPDHTQKCLTGTRRLPTGSRETVLVGVKRPRDEMGKQPGSGIEEENIDSTRQRITAKGLWREDEDNFETNKEDGDEEG